MEAEAEAEAVEKIMEAEAEAARWNWMEAEAEAEAIKKKLEAEAEAEKMYRPTASAPLKLYFLTLSFYIKQKLLIVCQKSGQTNGTTDVFSSQLVYPSVGPSFGLSISLFVIQSVWLSKIIQLCGKFSTTPRPSQPSFSPQGPFFKPQSH